MTDTELPPSAEELFAEWSWLRDLARRLVRDGHDADDLAQDVWLRVAARPPRAVRSLRAWLTRVLVNRSRDVARSETARADRERAVGDAGPRADLVRRVDAQRRVAAAVIGLPEPERSTVLLRFHEGRSVRETARRMGVPYETARARLARAMKRLRSELEEDYGREGRSWRSGLLPLVGGVVMTTKAKAAVAAGIVLLIAAGLGTWTAIAPDPAPIPRTPEAVPPPRIADAAPESTPEEKGPVAVEAAAADEPLDPEKGSVHGRLVREDGSPVADMLVRLSGSPAKEVRTDADGRFRIVNEWVDQNGRALIVGPRTGAVMVGVVNLRVGEEIAYDAKLPLGIPVEVEVVAAEDGKPREGVWVSFDALGPDHYPNGFGITDSEGRCRIGHLPRRDYRLRIASGEWMDHQERVDLRAGPPPGLLRVRLERPEELVLRVRPPTGKRHHLNISFLNLPADPVRMAPTQAGYIDEEGVFRGKAPPPGRYRIFLQVFGLLRHEFEDVEVRPREPIELSVERPTGVEVSGRLLDPDDAPIAGKVTLSGGDGGRGARSDESGAFRIEDVPPGRCWVSVGVRGQSLVNFMPPVEVGAEGLSGLTVRLPRGGSIRGRIVNSPNPAGHFLNLVRNVDGEWQTLGSATVRKDGSFSAPYVPAGRVTLQASAPRPEAGWGERVEVTVVEGEATEGVEIPWHPNPELVLEVVTADGAPFVGEIEGYVYPRDPRGGMSHHFRATTDERGRAVTRALSPGKLMLAVSPRGERNASSVEVEIAPADNEPIRVRLR